MKELCKIKRLLCILILNQLAAPLISFLSHVFHIFRASAEEAIRMLNGSQLGGQSIRLSWGRSPGNKQVAYVCN